MRPLLFKAVAKPALFFLKPCLRSDRLRDERNFVTIKTVVARSRAVALMMAACFAGATPGRALDAGAAPEIFEQQIRPLLKDYCLKCHSTEKQKGDLDLETFTSVESVKRHPKIWQGVAEQLANNEMPPKDKTQLPVAEKERLSKWVNLTLDGIARERAGDPGPVVLRRLSNPEYTYTIRDLTGVDSLEPAREFPVDGAAGEGFMNTGQALVMSPSLITKYLDAGKGIASHAVFLPDGIRFSSKTTTRDWTEEILAEIRSFYDEFTDAKGGDKVNLQGVVFETNGGGRLPLEKYLKATLVERDALAAGGKTIEVAASEHGLNAKYFGALIKTFSGNEPSLLLDGIRARWRVAKPSESSALAIEIVQWQKALWKFSSVGHIGKTGGPKAWMEPVNPLVSRQEVRLKIPASQDGKDVTLYLMASDAGDGSANDRAVWERPRLVAPGRPDLLLRDVRDVTRELGSRRKLIFESAARCLNAAAEAEADATDVNALAARHEVDVKTLTAWLNYFGIGQHAPVKIDSYFTTKLAKTTKYDFINGWGVTETPEILANSSDEAVRIPGKMKPHSVAVHPSPKLQAVVGWRSPLAARLRVEATVAHAHPECGNGVTWSLEVQRGAVRERIESGIAQGSKEIKVGPIENIAVKPGDLVSLHIGPRNADHSCDLTAVDLILTDGAHTWNLASDVSPDILAGNPHADSSGNADVWHFYTEPDNGGNEGGPLIPPGSLADKWRSTSSRDEKGRIAQEIQKLLLSGPGAESPDAKLYRQLVSVGGPLLARIAGEVHKTEAGEAALSVGLDPAIFGRNAAGQPIDGASLSVQAPSVIEVHLPADLAAGCELVATGALEAGADGSVQFQLLTDKPERAPGLVTSGAAIAGANGTWASSDQPLTYGTPIVINDGSPARVRVEEAFEKFRQLFPAALCYTKIVPVDEVVTLTLFHREDGPLSRLMLDDGQKAKLDRLWDQLHFVSRDALTLVDAYAQLMEFATQDGDPKLFEPMRKPINEAAANFRQRLVAVEPQHLNGVLAFADRAYRRPLSENEKEELRALYAKLRTQELPHEEAIRLTLARVLVAPAFLYRAEKPGPGIKQAPINDWELANRLSYFLWSSMPDQELRELAAAGKLRDPGTLAAQTRRMLNHARAPRLATEFACQWLHIRDFDSLDEKSERHFPTFNALRGAMYEESIRFFTDFFQHDGSVLGILDADHTFLNETLAKHYGIPGVTGDQWRRVDGIKKFARGGILGQAATLAKQSGASRTSPILRGNWVAEVLLGDKLPRPPKDVPQLPEDEALETLTVRQLTEKHTSDPRCAGCHSRIDAFGFALETFDAIGARRERDLAGRPIDTRAKVMDGTELEGIEGLRNYLLTNRRETFVRQFCRKLLGYGLGRGVQLSDEPLLAQMQERLKSNNYRITTAIDAIVGSPQFLDIRGREMNYED
ncbi:MAG: cytochrome [Chthoniobacteraceae bacterium]|nr:cytochrome [Chthoniobacteraceae bacterium]